MIPHRYRALRPFLGNVNTKSRYVVGYPYCRGKKWNIITDSGTIPVLGSTLEMETTIEDHAGVLLFVGDIFKERGTDRHYLVEWCTDSNGVRIYCQTSKLLIPLSKICSKDIIRVEGFVKR